MMMPYGAINIPRSKLLHRLRPCPQPVLGPSILSFLMKLALRGALLPPWNREGIAPHQRRESVRSRQVLSQHLCVSRQPSNPQELCTHGEHHTPKAGRIVTLASSACASLAETWSAATEESEKSVATTIPSGNSLEYVSLAMPQTVAICSGGVCDHDHLPLNRSENTNPGLIVAARRYSSRQAWRRRHSVIW